MKTPDFLACLPNLFRLNSYSLRKKQAVISRNEKEQLTFANCSFLF